MWDVGWLMWEVDCEFLIADCPEGKPLARIDLRLVH